MKILHICVGGPYTDGWNYQENMITKFQAIAGHEVSILVSQWAWGNDGKIEKITDTNYVNSDGVRVFRLPIKGKHDVFYRFKRFSRFYETLENISPDIIFVHNLQFFDVDQIVKYSRSHEISIFADNHADFSNSARTKFAKMFYRVVWRHYAKLIEPYTNKFYGVLPARVDFLVDVYGLPKNKCELLVMGADDEKVNQSNNPEIRKKIREKHDISTDDFLLVTGGKIDSWKTQTLLLMEAVSHINNPKVKLIVFGSVTEDLKKKFESLCLKDKVIYIGWINSDDSYKYFSASDLVVFPGRHSVFWEQVAGIGVPMVVKYWKGTTHIDLGGNVKLLYEDSADEIRNVIEDLVLNTEKYNQMKTIAYQKGMSVFSYKEIAKRSVRS